MYKKCGFSTQLKFINRVKNPDELRDWCRQMKSYLLPDVSNYARGRYRLWLFHQIDFRNGSLSPGYFEQRIWDFSQRIYPGSNIGLLTFGGTFADGKVSNGKINLHRDHTYACPQTRSINLGRATFAYGEPLPADYQLNDGDIVEFNCKILHSIKEIQSPERFSLVFWKLNEQKGYRPL